MMTTSTAVQHSFRILSSDIQIKSANNAITSVVGITEELQIDVNGHCYKIAFIILEHDDHEILLGLDWFRLTGANLHPSDQILKFLGTNVPLFSNPSPCAYPYDDEVLILSSTVVDEYDIDPDIDWFTANHVEMSPVIKLSPDKQSIFEHLKTQLEPRYRGPYTIHKQVKNGNYQAKNLLGSVLKTIYPRHNLKIVAPDEIEDEHCEV
jgi:hypothetical protein